MSRPTFDHDDTAAAEERNRLASELNDIAARAPRLNPNQRAYIEQLKSRAKTSDPQGVARLVEKFKRDTAEVPGQASSR